MMPVRNEFNFGVGIRLTRSTDPLIVKLVLGYRFGLSAKQVQSE